MDDFVEVVKKSSPAELNKVQLYKNGEVFQYLNIKFLEKYFIKIAKYHHFYFSVDKLGVVRVQEEANGELKEFNLWKDESKITESIKEIREMIFPTLTPPPLKLERQL